MNCQICSLPATVITSSYSRCSNHFNQYVFAKVIKLIKKYSIDISSKILVAYSSGKDSASVLYILKKLGFKNLSAVYIKLDFDFIEPDMSLIKDDVKIVDLKKTYSISAREIKSKTDKSYCRICSTLRRYFLNRFAFENGYDTIATGHNMSDIVSSAFANIKNNFYLGFSNLSPYLLPKTDVKLVGRFKPLFFLTDYEIKKFADINSIVYSDKKCPHSINDFLKKHLRNIEIEDYTIIEKMAHSLIEFSKKTLEYSALKGIKSNTCKNCGYSTASDVCVFCKTINLKNI